MKQALKLILSLLVGVFIGFGGVVLCIGLFSDMTIVEFLNKFAKTDLMELAGGLVVSLLSFFVGIFLQIIAHEAGHLTFGLLTGYKFVSFRILNYVLLKQDGKLMIKKFGIAGTGGQCLLLPPDCPIDKLPVFWYNAGGIIFNILLTALLTLIWLLGNVHALVAVFLSITSLVGVFLILINGIPIKGLTNDGANMLLLRKDMTLRKYLSAMLHVNAMGQAGVLPKDMPDDYFDVPEPIDYKNVFLLQMEMMKASRLLDMERYDEVFSMMKSVVDHKEDVIELFYREAVCELIYLYLLRGEKEEAKKLLDKPMKAYIKQYSKVMSGKCRLQCAIALVLEEDEHKAVEIYKHLYERKDDFLMQAEVKSDLNLIESLFKSKNVEYGK